MEGKEPAFLQGLQQLVGLSRSNTKKDDGDTALCFLLVSKSASFLFHLTSQNLRGNTCQVEVPEHAPRATEKSEWLNCCANSSPGTSGWESPQQRSQSYTLQAAIDMSSLGIRSYRRRENPTKMKTAININCRRRGESVIFPSLPQVITLGILSINAHP